MKSKPKEIPMKSTRKADIAAKIARKHGVSPRTVARWKSQRDDRAAELNATDNAPAPTNIKRQLEERRLRLICERIELELKSAGPYVPLAEYERRAREFCGFVHGAFAKFRNELPAQLVGCDAVTISNRINTAVARVFDEVRNRYKVTRGDTAQRPTRDDG